MKPNYSDPVNIMALTLYGEIRGGDDEAKRHVADVILNRAIHPTWWGKSILSVCLAHWQFSCWWIDDANRKAMMDVPASDPVYRDCEEIAKDYVSTPANKEPDDTTLGADSYYAKNMRPPPPWVNRATHTLDDAWHSFWKVDTADVAHAPDPGAPTVSTHVVSSDDRAEDLNQAELERIQQEHQLTGIRK